MKRLLSLLLIALCLAPIVAQGQTVVSTTQQATPQVAPQAAVVAPAIPDAPSWSYSIIPSFVSQYMFRGALVDGASFQPSVEADYGDYAVGVWVSTPLSGKVPGSSNPEVDLYASWKHTLTDSLSLSPGFTLYTYPSAPTDQGFYRATFEPSVALVYTVGALTLTPKVYYDVVLQGFTYEGTAAYAYPMPAFGTELDLAATVGTFLLDHSINASPSQKASGNYWSVGAGIPFTITKASKLTIGWAYAEGWSSAGTVGRGVLSASYAYSF